LKNFRKKIFFSDSKIAKGTPADDCASNSTKIITVDGRVQEKKRDVTHGHTAEHKGSDPAIFFFFNFLQT
jgi:hypothetical protein